MARSKEPLAFVFPFGLHENPSYVVAYYIGYCAICSRSWIGIIGLTGNHYEMLASDENSLPNQGLTVIPLGSGSLEFARFLAYGRSWGDAHGRLNAIAYSFDGRQLHRIWSRLELPQGKITVTSAKIILSFLTSLPSSSRERIQVYTVTPEGIQLQNASERPAK